MPSVFAVAVLALSLMAASLPVLAAEAGTTKVPDNALFDGRKATDHDLEMIVNGAYAGAFGQAIRHDNSFNSQNLSYDVLRQAMRRSLEKEGYGEASVAAQPMANAALAKACATDGRIDLRVAFNDDGLGISVVAVSGSRMAAYEYDPTRSDKLAITHADHCWPNSIPNGGGSARAADAAH